jgi:phosphomevalonate kinase
MDASRTAVAAAAVVGAAALVFVLYRSRREKKLPLAIIIFSGKRKSGKDYCSDRLLALVGPSVAEIGRLSAPLKKAYADEHGLDYEKLLGASSYKERYRESMIAWGEQRRDADPGFFARLVLRAATRPVLIISDARRPTDLAFFERAAARVVAVRVRAPDAARAARGWTFAAGVDDAPSECGLDGRAAWDVVIDNDGGDGAAVDAALEALAAVARAAAAAA